MKQQTPDIGKELQPLVSLMLFLMIGAVLERMTISSLRELLHRQPTPLELSYYQLELERWVQARWWQELQLSLDKIHNFVWDIQTEPQQPQSLQLEELINERDVRR